MGSFVGPSPVPGGTTGLVARPSFLTANTFPTTYTEAKWAAASFAGLNTGNNHLQATPTADTSTVIAAGVSGMCIVIYEIGAMTTGGNSDMTGTLAEGDATDDLFRYTGTKYGMCRHTTYIKLAPGKGLIHYRADGNTGSATSDANILCVSYAYLPLPA